MLLPLFSALLGILAFPHWGFWPLGFVFLAPFFLFLIKEKKFWRLVGGAALFRLILGLGVVYFVFEPLIFGFGLLIFLGLPISLFLIRKFIEKKFPQSAEQTAILIALPFLWTIWDYLSTRYLLLPALVFSSGNIFGPSPFLGLAGVYGLPFLTFFGAVMNVLLAALFLNRFLIHSGENAAGENILPKRKRFLLLSMALISLIFFGLTLSQIKLKDNSSRYKSLTRKVEMVLVSTNNSFDGPPYALASDGLAEILRRTIEPLKQELMKRKGDIVVLPENLIAREFPGADEEASGKFGVENQGVYIGLYRELARSLGKPLLGTLTTIRGGRRYKTTFLFDGEGEIIDTYNKSRLTFLSETWPFGNWRPFYFDWLKGLNPEVAAESPAFDANYEYRSGPRKILTIDDLKFASLICLEVHYPDDLLEFKEKGARFFVHTSNNRWLVYGLNTYLALTDSLRKIESVWLGTPILINGRYEKAGLITPDGKMESVNYESAGKNYGIWEGYIRY